MRKGSRAKRPTPGTKEVRRAQLVAEAQANPYAFFTAEETGIIFGFGADTMTTLRALGAPIVARQMHPGLLLRWIELNADKVPKIRSEEDPA